jgi:DNA repair protein RadC
MKILDMPYSSRPRERFLKVGAEALSDAELFAILLRTGTRETKNKDGEITLAENAIDMSNKYS